MAAIVNNDTLALQLERVRDKLPLMFERDNVFFAKVEKKGDTVSTRNARIPLELRPGGRFGLYDPNGGNMGRGSGTKYEVAQVTPVHLKEGIEITRLVELATNSSEKAIENAVRREVKNAMSNFRAHIDKLCNRASTGQLGVVSSVAGSVITLAADSAFSPSARFRVGQGVVFADAGLTTLRNSGAVAVITAISDAGPSITVDAVPGAVIGTDVILLEGSTVSGGAVTSTALFGIPYHQNNATSGTWLSLTRSATSLPEVITPSENASSASLTTTHIRRALNKIRLALGVDAMEGLTAYLHPAQEHAYEDLGIVISEIIKTANSDERFDPFFGVKTMAGVPILCSINADKTRIDFLHMASWGRVVTEEIGYFKVGDTQVFAPYTNGAPDAAQLWYLVTSFQLFTENPRKGSYIYGLAVPSGY